MKRIKCKRSQAPHIRTVSPARIVRLKRTGTPARIYTTWDRLPLWWDIISQNYMSCNRLRL